MFRRADLTRTAPFVALVTLSLVLLLIGSLGLGQRFIVGKSSTALGSYVTWGLWIALYVYLVWLEIGSLLVYAVLTHVFRWKALMPMRALAYFTALVILSMALFTIWIDLGHPLRFWRAYGTPSMSSPIVWMVWLHTAYLVLLAAKTWIALRPGRHRALEILSWVSVPLGVALLSTVGAVFGVVAARPYWNAMILPLIFVTTSLAAGGALLTLLYVIFWRAQAGDEYAETSRTLGRALLSLLVVALYAALVNAVLLLYAGVPANVGALRQVLTGPYWYSFWIFHVVLGVLVPLALLIRHPSPARVGTAAFLMVATFIMIPLNVVIPGQVEPQFKGLAEAYVHGRLTTTYFPSPTEWLVVVFVIGFGLLAFSLGSRILPVLKPREEV